MPDLSELRANEEHVRSTLEIEIDLRKDFDALCSLNAYREAIEARTRAELLASGTPLWVATDHNGEWTVCCDMPRPDGNGWRTGRAYGQQMVSPTPPGTCRRAVLTILPEEGENDGR